MAPALPILKKIVQKNIDTESLADACWAFSYFSDGDDNRIMVRPRGLCRVVTIAHCHCHAIHLDRVGWCGIAGGDQVWCGAHLGAPLDTPIDEVVLCSPSQSV